MATSPPPQQRAPIGDLVSLHRFVLETETRLRSLEQVYHGVKKSRHEWTMWLPKKFFCTSDHHILRLLKVSSEAQWNQLLALRLEVEISFGITDPSTVRKIICDIRKKSEQLNGSWYLAQIGDLVVGEVGIVPFPSPAGLVGRLQDVDILPHHQGNGFGRQLLIETCDLANFMGLNSLCLMAKANDWPKDWYRRFGFVKTGEVKNA